MSDHAASDGVGTRELSEGAEDGFRDGGGDCALWGVFLEGENSEGGKVG